LKREVILKVAQVGFTETVSESFLSASEKRNWAVNDNAVEIKLAVSYKTDFAFGR
jgi:hypothetical protein